MTVRTVHVGIYSSYICLAPSQSVSVSTFGDSGGGPKVVPVTLYSSITCSK